MKHLEDKELHKQTVRAAKTEKAAVSQLLAYLSEVNRRKVFVDFGHSTLHKYTMLELGYSSSEAYARIQAMQLSEKSPLAEEMIREGELPLSNAALINQFAGDINESIDKILEEARGKSHRDLEEKLREKSGRPKNTLKVTLSEEILKKMKKLGWELSEVEIIEALLDKELKEQELSAKPRKSSPDMNKPIRYYPVQVRRDVLKRSGHQCEDVTDEKRCPERRNLQYDHIHEFSFGGPRDSENIRMLCSGHNQRRAVLTFGIRTGLA